jgi:hypothetical protein
MGTSNPADPTTAANPDLDTEMENGEGKKLNGRGRGPSMSSTEDPDSAPPPTKRRTPRSGDPPSLPIMEATPPPTPRLPVKLPPFSLVGTPRSKPRPR